MLRSGTGAGAASYTAKAFGLRTSDVGAGGQCGEGKEGDERERLANGHGNLGRKGEAVRYTS